MSAPGPLPQTPPSSLTPTAARAAALQPVLGPRDAAGGCDGEQQHHQGGRDGRAHRGGRWRDLRSAMRLRGMEWEAECRYAEARQHQILLYTAGVAKVCDDAEPGQANILLKFG